MRLLIHNGSEVHVMLLISNDMDCKFGCQVLLFHLFVAIMDKWTVMTHSHLNISAVIFWLCLFVCSKLKLCANPSRNHADNQSEIEPGFVDVIQKWSHEPHYSYFLGFVWIE